PVSVTAARWPRGTVAVVQTRRCATPSPAAAPDGYRQNGTSATSSPSGVRASIIPSFPAAQRAETSLALLPFSYPCPILAGWVKIVLGLIPSAWSWPACSAPSGGTHAGATRP